MWLVWRPGSPDPSRLRPAVHHEDPAKDRDTSDRLAVIPIAPEHRGMSIRDLLLIQTYNLPADVRGSVDGEKTLLAEPGR